tara:strand:+ start:31013 stop:31207 length:195 start_codon:yes stop_codon:yes gene_type:complete
MGPTGFDMVIDYLVFSLRQQYKQGEFNLNGNEQIEANMSIVHSILNGSYATVGEQVHAELEYAA